MAKFCLRSCWMTPKLFFTKIEFLGFRCTMIYQCFLLRLDCPGPFHKIMTVSNEKFDYILSHWVWQHCKNIAVTSQNNPIERIFGTDHTVFRIFFQKVTMLVKRAFSEIHAKCYPAGPIQSFGADSFALGSSNSSDHFSAFTVIFKTSAVIKN